VDGLLRVNTRVPREQGLLFDVVEEEGPPDESQIFKQLLISDRVLVTTSEFRESSRGDI